MISHSLNNTQQVNQSKNGGGLNSVADENMLQVYLPSAKIGNTDKNKNNKDHKNKTRIYSTLTMVFTVFILKQVFISML